MQNEISERLRYWRKEKKLTQQQVADKIGKDRTCYTKYESGRVMPRLQTMRDIVKAFGISFDEFFGEE